MDRDLYNKAAATIAGGRTFVHEGRTASNMAELDWMAREVYGFEPHEAKPAKTEKQKPEKTSAETGGSTGTGSTLDTMKAPELRALATELGIQGVVGKTNDALRELIREAQATR